MNVVVISNNYPSNQIPNRGAFVYNLIQKLSKYHTITVIAPFKAHDLLRKKTKSGYGKENCTVLRPVYLSFSNKKLGPVNTGKWSTKAKARVVNTTLNNLGFKPDVIYAHFLQNAASGMKYIKKHNIPLVIASGESTYTKWEDKVKNEESIIQDLKKYTNHFICVSSTNHQRLKKLGFNEDKMTIVPNAVDYDLFRPMNKAVCKEKLDISKEKFVVGFIGYFIHRKGPNRVIKAIESLKDKNIEFLAIGSRGKLPERDFVKTMGPVPNFQLPEIYNAFDIFVLPTLNEGHCNVIEEAKACGIPIISSLGTSVEGQIDKNTGILINPLAIEDIAKAIKELKDKEELRKIMSDNLIALRGELSLDNRAKRISLIIEKTNNES